MSQYHQNTFSLWQSEVILSDMPTLKKNISTEVCIIGAGISGLLTAYQLQKKGFKVVVLEKDDLGFSETALTSAHLSSALDDGYVNLIKWHGKDGAKMAYHSHQTAIELIEDIARTENIECDFKRVNGYLFLGPKDDRKVLEEELHACEQLEIPEVALIDQPESAFFESGICLRFTEQAQFEPLKFMNGLVERIRADGGVIYTNSRVETVHGGEEPVVVTASGYRVHCDSVVVATNIPITSRFEIPLKESAYRTYVIALKIPHGAFVPALFWDTADPYHYVRTASSQFQDHDVLIVGGEDHRVGQEAHNQDKFQKLVDWAGKRLGIQNPEMIASWSGQIQEPIDGLAYIGKSPGDENVFIVTGDSGHGLTHGAIAAEIISSLIAEGEHPWEKLYSPNRFSWRGLNEFVKENVQTGIQYRDWLVRETRDASDLVEGEGAVISEGFAKVAAYRDKKGELHKFSAVCPHLQGIVRWNEAEKTFDCPCHGSRFSKMGEVINGPAINNLEKIETPVETPVVVIDKMVRLKGSSL